MLPVFALSPVQQCLGQEEADGELAARAITLKPSGFAFLLSQCLRWLTQRERASSCYRKDTGRRETWVLVLAFSLPYVSPVLSLDLPFYIYKIRGLDLIILKSCAAQHPVTWMERI